MERERIIEAVKAHQRVIEESMLAQAGLIEEISSCIRECFARGNKLLICGNGGSAADAQHIAGEFVNRLRFDRPALPALALTVDTSVLTCIANDSSFDLVFSRQVEAFAQPGDVLVGISTSGGARNVLNAFDAARLKGAATVGFTGMMGRERMGAGCDFCFVAESEDTVRIQECHEFAWHVICEAVESRLFVEERVGEMDEQKDAACALGDCIETES